MHPVTFIYKVKRRLRRKGEQLCPKLFFAYGRGPSSPDRFFEQFLEVVPFLPMVNLKERLPEEEQQELICKAEAICDHTFDLLGSGSYRFEDGLDWHLEFKSGFRWPDHVVHSRCTSRAGVDIKVPWELSRFNHAVTLGLAFQISNDRKYAKEFVQQVQGWIVQNPVGYGVNWACPMDVAFRAVNWLVGFSLMSDALMQAQFQAFRQSLVSSLWKHARFIYAHLEWLGPKEDVGANHFLSDLVGVFTLGIFFKGTRRGQKWFEFSHRQLQKEMMRQVTEDGVHFECSPSYHRLCLEMFLWCRSLGQRSGRSFSEGYYARLQKMQQFVADYMKSSGDAPLIGDNDDGRLLNSGLLNMGDHRYVQSAGEGGEFFVDRFMLDGSTEVKSEPSMQSAAYPDGGFYFLKNERAQVCVRAGRLAYGGGHAHNDQLSFELTVNGRDIFMDRGSYLYTSDPNARNRYRSTAAHNVMQANDMEQNRSGPSLFGMPDETRTRVVEQATNILKAVHTGFKALGRLKSECGRNLELKPDQLVITDTFPGAVAGDVIRWTFNLAPGLNAIVEEEQVLVEHNKETVCSMNLSFPADIAIRDFAHSPSYGVIANAQRITFEYIVPSKSDINLFEFEFEIRWE